MDCYSINTNFQENYICTIIRSRNLISASNPPNGLNCSQHVSYRVEALILLTSAGFCLSALLA